MGFGRMGSRGGFGGMGKGSGGAARSVSGIIPPSNTAAPAVTGTETEGETLTSTSGTWTGAATITYAYQWYQAVLDGSNDVVTDMDGVPLLDFPISGATASTYVLQAGDVGEKIFCYVTATNGVGSAGKASNATGLIAAASSEDSATTAWVNAVVLAGGTVSSGRRTIVNDLIVGLKTDGLFAKGKLALLAAENSQSALIEVCALTQASAVNSPSFTVDQGYAGDASTSRIDTNINASTDANFTQNSASFGAWKLSAGAHPERSHGWLAGDTSVGTYLSFGLDAGDPVFANINTVFAADIAPAFTFYASGFLVGNRSASGAVQLYKDGASVATGTGTSVAPANLNFWIGGRNFGGGTNSMCDDLVAAYWVGSSLDSTEQANLFTRVETYLTAVGAI